MSVWLSSTQRDFSKYFSNTLREELSTLSIFQSDVKLFWVWSTRSASQCRCLCHTSFFSRRASRIFTILLCVPLSQYEFAKQICFGHSGEVLPKTLIDEALKQGCILCSSRENFCPAVVHKFAGKVKSYLLLLSWRKLSVCLPWKPFLRFPSCQGWVQSSYSFLLCPFWGIEADLQHYLKQRCQMKVLHFKFVLTQSFFVVF